MNPEPVAILVPVLRRPHRVAPLVETIAAVTPWPHRVVFLVSPDDPDELKACRKVEGGDRVRVEVVLWAGGTPGDYAKKINAGVRRTTEPLLFQGADDLLFHPGWLEEACRVMLPGVGVVGTNDLYNPRVLKGRHSTHSLVARSYIEEFGTIDEPGIMLHEGYPHEYCDDEMVATAFARGAYAHAHDSIVEHLHPYAGKGDSDSVYDLGHSRSAEGMALFRKRGIMWKHKATSSQFRAHRLRASMPAPEPEPVKTRDPSIGVIVASYGPNQWERLALKRAVPSVQRQLRPNDTLTVLHVPDGVLHDVRNRAAIIASERTPEWLVFLDADDQLDDGYLDAIRDAAPKRADALLVPSIYDQGRGMRAPETRPMAEVNRAVIGTAIRARLFFDLGGFRDWPVYEDWDLWLRALRAGARMIEVPGAVYRVFRSGRGRNRPGRVLAARTYEAIRSDLGFA